MGGRYYNEEACITYYIGFDPAPSEVSGNLAINFPAYRIGFIMCMFTSFLLKYTRMGENAYLFIY